MLAKGHDPKLCSHCADTAARLDHLAALIELLTASLQTINQSLEYNLHFVRTKIFWDAFGHTSVALALEKAREDFAHVQRQLGVFRNSLLVEEAGGGQEEP